MITATQLGFKQIIFFVFLVLMGFRVHSQCPQIVWSDEFSGTTLDQTKWNYQIGDGCAEGICGWGNNELQSYQEANITVNNGILSITAKKERIKGKKYTSGRINSKAKGDFTYGRFEASIKLPAGDGLWPAFWMLSTTEPYGGWPQSGEIDIMEFVASNPDEIFGTIHYGNLYPNNQFQGNSISLASGNFPDAFHEFAIEWEPGEIRWFLDGILYSTKAVSDLAPYNWPFDHDFHFLLNVAVGGNLGGTVNESMLPATMEVDYVRVYDGYKSYITGPMVVANQATGQAFSIENVSNGTNVSWTVPTGATIVSGQGTPSVVIDFGTASGTVSASFNDGCSTQNLAIAVEVEYPYNQAFSFENFDDPANATYATSTGTLVELANPSPDAINGSAMVGQYVRNNSEQYDVLVYDVSNISNASEYVTKAKKFYVDVYTSAPIGTDILLQLETSDATATNYPTGRHSRYIASTSQQNAWERLVFTLLDEPDISASATSIQSMILLFATNTFTGDTYYFDNLDSYNQDNGSGQNNAPSVSISNPSDGASFTAGTQISVSANASDSDGSISQVEFFANGTSIGIDANQPYSLNWTVPLGSTTLTAVATDDLNASTTSTVVNVMGQSGGTPTSIHVASIVTGTSSAGQGNKRGTATVNIVDDLGNNIANASVTGTFSGTFSEQATATTDANGLVQLQTTAVAKGSVTVDLCVDIVTHGTLAYASADNVITCTNGAGSQRRGQIDKRVEANNLTIFVLPNPANKKVFVRIEGIDSAVSLEIMDTNGRIVDSRQEVMNNASLNISNLANGIYFIKVQDKQGLATFTKLIKR